jgi:histidinol-phosphate aminotransferase
MFSRRTFIGRLGALSATAPFLSEAALAQDARAGMDPKSSVVWLDANENPAGPPRSALEAMARSVAESGRYHFDEWEPFAKAIAASEDVKPSHVLFGVGSSDVIAAAICAFASAQKPMITASPSYDIVVKLARKLGRQVVEVPLTQQWAYPVKALADEADKAGGGLIYVCNPNNPTSSLTSTADIDWLATNLPPDTVLLVDEAYLEFVDPGVLESAIRHVRADRSVVVSRTFSKIYGMAGARAGFGCTRPDLIVAMNDFMDNVIPLVGLRGASAALAEKATLVPRRRQANARVRGELCSWLRSNGIPYVEPHGNFVFIDTGRDVKAFGAEMRARGVAVGRQFPPLNTMLRVTVGTDEDMARFREVFMEVRNG